MINSLKLKNLPADYKNFVKKCGSNLNYQKLQEVLNSIKKIGIWNVMPSYLVRDCIAITGDGIPLAYIMPDEHFLEFSMIFDRGFEKSFYIKWKEMEVKSLGELLNLLQNVDILYKMVIINQFGVDVRN